MSSLAAGAASNGAARRIAIIGGGWSGLACALALRDCGARVDLFEASPLWGGRARAARIRLGGEAVDVDGGQHLLIGAYRECLALLGEFGLDGPPALVRRPLALVSPSGLELRRRRLPGGAGLAAGLLLARGLAWRSRWAALWMMAGLRRRDWRPHPGVSTVSELLAAWRQPRELVRTIWEPLCVGALNTPIAEACAASFVAVLRDTLGGKSDAADLLLPSVPLASLVADPAVGRLRAAGVGLHRSTPIVAIDRDAGGWTLRTARARDAIEARYDHVVVATDAHAAANLVEPASPAVADRLRGFDFAPIATVYLGWRTDVDLPVVSMLDEDRDAGSPGQWLFDRGRQAGLRIGAVVVSARDRIGHLDNEALGAAVGRQVAAQLGLPAPIDARTLTERRATWRCTPDRPRLTLDAAASRSPGLWLAGDYLDPEYPSTLESALRGGRRVAAAIAADLSAGADPSR